MKKGLVRLQDDIIAVIAKHNVGHFRAPRLPSVIEMMRINIMYHMLQKIPVLPGPNKSIIGNKKMNLKTGNVISNSYIESVNRSSSQKEVHHMKKVLLEY